MALIAGTGLAAVTGVGSAAASPAPQLHVAHVLPGDFGAPLQFAVSGKQVAVADSFASALFLVGHEKPIATGFPATHTEENSGDLAGVDIDKGSIAYTTTKADHRTTLLVVLRHGKKVLQADLGAYEQRHNPDRHVTYGPVDPTAVSDKCKAELPAVGASAVPYTGLKDSHPYAVAGLRDGSWLVADAGGNDILRVSPRGRISTVAVLPAQTITVTPEIASQGVPDCVGVAYRFESVPTDVEVTRAGTFVSTLSGAEADGRVYELGRCGHVHRIAGGLPALTNIAVTPAGRVFVVQLGTGISVLTKHGPKQVAALPGAAAIEWANGKLYASTAPALTGGKDPGRIVVLK